MKPKHYRRSRMWVNRRFILKAPFRTNSAEVLSPNTIVRTTGEINHSRWFVEVEFFVKARRELVRIDAWVRRKELLNAALAIEITDSVKNFSKANRSITRALRILGNFARQKPK